MKNLLSILVVLALATTLAFSTAPNVNDLSGSNKTGTGTFQCTVLTPLTISSPGTLPIFGEFVAGATYSNTIDPLNWNVTNDAVMTFNITGDGTHSFYFDIDPTLTATGGHSITIDWTAGGTALTSTEVTNGYKGNRNLVANASTIVGTVTSVTAGATPGTATFLQTVTVSYNTL